MAAVGILSHLSRVLPDVLLRCTEGLWERLGDPVAEVRAAAGSLMSHFRRPLDLILVPFRARFWLSTLAIGAYGAVSSMAAAVEKEAHMGMEARLPRTPAGQTKSKNSQIWKVCGGSFEVFLDAFLIFFDAF